MNDNESILRGVAQELSAAGHCQLDTDKGANALQMLKRGRYDLLIQDLERRSPNGFELYYRIKKQDKLRNLPIILCTIGVPRYLGASDTVLIGDHSFEGLIRADFDYDSNAFNSIPRYMKSPVPLLVEGYYDPSWPTGPPSELVHYVFDARSRIENAPGEFERRNKVLWPAAIRALRDPHVLGIPFPTVPDRLMPGMLVKGDGRLTRRLRYDIE